MAAGHTLINLECRCLVEMAETPEVHHLMACPDVYLALFYNTSNCTLTFEPKPEPKKMAVRAVSSYRQNTDEGE